MLARDQAEDPGLAAAQAEPGPQTKKQSPEKPDIEDHGEPDGEEAEDGGPRDGA